MIYTKLRQRDNMRMARFRKLNGGLWGTEETNNDDNDDFPMDEDDQARLIEKFEARNYQDNEITIRVLSVLYLFCAGLFLMMVTKIKSRNVASMLLGGIQSMICSCVTLRYDLVNDYYLFKKIKVRVSSKTIDMFNYMILILLLWISITKFEDKFSLQILFQIPLMLCLISVLMKRWAKEIDQDLNKLRELKYKYKSA